MYSKRSLRLERCANDLTNTTIGFNETHVNTSVRCVLSNFTQIQEGGLHAISSRYSRITHRRVVLQERLERGRQDTHTFDPMGLPQSLTLLPFTFKKVYVSENSTQGGHNHT